MAVLNGDTISKQALKYAQFDRKDPGHPKKDAEKLHA
jgi:hypothetical protein